MIGRAGFNLGMIAAAAFTLLAALPTCRAGQFKHGLGRGDSIKAKLTVPPTVRIGRSTLAIDVRDATAPQAAAQIQGESATVNPTVPAAQLQAALDQVFRQTFTIVQSNGEALLRVAVIQYTPPESAMQTVQQKVRAPSFNTDGTPVIDPQTGRQATAEQTVAVEYWNARGQIAVRAEVVDASGVLVDGYAAQASVEGRQLISVNGQDRVDRTQIPTHAQILARLIGNLVVQFQPRYCPPGETVDIPLAVDEELRPGNKLAKDGDFAAAARSWTEAAPAAPHQKADQIHNLGAVYEAQAYHLLARQSDLAKVRPLLERAAAQYADASRLDPKEKYFARAAERIRKAERVLAELQEKEDVRLRTLAGQGMPSPWPPGLAQAAAPPGVPPGTAPPPNGSGEIAGALAPQETATQEPANDNRPDTPQEAVFRQLVRLRVRSGNPLDSAIHTQLETSGVMAYSLTALQARRVVNQESQAWGALQAKLAIYRDSFAAFSQDGKLSAPEREALNTLWKNLALPEAEVKEIESGSTQLNQSRPK